MKKVSAIITTHNRSRLLKRAIESVLSQTYKNMECIVVDDNSTDNTREVCNSYPVNYIYIPKDESCGGNYARNLGIKNSTGEYCAFLDDDDVWLPTKTEKQLVLLEDKNCECVYCLRLIESVQNGVVLGQKEEGLAYKYEGDLSKIIFRHSITSTSCLFVTKKILDRLGGFDENLPKMQEFELLIRISQVSKIYYYHDEALVKYTIDTTDKNRISNDPNRLPIAADYIKTKHAFLLREAGLLNRLWFEDRMLVAKYNLCRQSANHFSSLKYSLYYYFVKPFRKLYECVYFSGRQCFFHKLMSFHV